MTLRGTRPWRAGGQATTTEQRDRRSDRLYNSSGRAVGRLRDGWLVKHVVTARHQLRRPPAWSCDVTVLEQLAALGGVGVLLIDERGQRWQASLASFERFGLVVDRGHGRQLALPLARWRRVPVGQLGLFDTHGGGQR